MEREKMNGKIGIDGPQVERINFCLPSIYPFAWREEINGECEALVKSLWVTPAMASGAEDLARCLDLVLVTDVAQAEIRILPLNETEALAGGDVTFGAEMSPERYYFDTTRSPFTVGAVTVQGAMMALQSLKQLRLNADRWASARVWDAPALRIRGVHCFLPAREDIPFFKRWLAWLASLKFNTLFLEIGGGLEYKRHPEVNAAWEKFADRVGYNDKSFASRMHSHPNAMHGSVAGGSFLTQIEARDLAETARSLQIEVIPEVQSLSHSYYLCCAHPEIAEDPSHQYPDTYCPHHPDTYPLLFDVIDEVAEVFTPKTIHIGHDEWYTIGCCPRCREKQPSDILYKDVKRIHNYLLKKKIGCAMWGDKFMNLIVGGREHAGRDITREDIKGETYQALDKLAVIPVHREILILDWYWGLDPFSQDYFNNKGFSTVFGNFDPLSFNIARLRAPGVVGAEVSTWKAARESELARHGLIQKVLFSANAFWWKNCTDAAKVDTYDAVKYRMASTRAQLGARTEPKGEWTAVALKSAVVVEPYPGSLRHVCQAPCVIHVRGKSRALRFVHAIDPGFDMAKDRAELSAKSSIGCYVIRTENQEYRVELTDSINILQLHAHPLTGDANALMYWADVAEEGRDAWGRPMRWHALIWVNPDPTDTVKEVAIEGHVILAGLDRMI